MPNNFKTSPTGLALIRFAEGTDYHLYNDPANNCTVGTGHLVHHGPISGDVSEMPFAHGCTVAQETDLLQRDVQYAEHAVNTMVLAPMTQNQFDAFVDFAFNEGTGRFQRSDLLRYFNAGNLSAVPAAFRSYVRINGVVNAGKDGKSGLVGRRNREIELFQKAG